jgi:hypothetical protein
MEPSSGELMVQWSDRGTSRDGVFALANRIGELIEDFTRRSATREDRSRRASVSA